MVKIILVDENDKVIGSKERGSLDYSKDIYRVSALWIMNSKGEILLAKRALNKAHNPGCWGPAVAGTNEMGESYESNIVKEAEEELGIKNSKPKLGPKKRVALRYNYFCQWFLLKVDKSADEFIIQKEEVDHVKWISKKELIKEITDNPEQFVPSMRGVALVNELCSS